MMAESSSMADEELKLEEPSNRKAGGSTFDSSLAGSLPSTDSQEGVEGSRNHDPKIVKKRHRLRRIRSRLSRKLQSLEEDQQPSSEQTTPRGTPWLTHQISMRRPSGMDRKRQEALRDLERGHSGHGPIGTGSTRQQLPEHVVNDNFEVPEFACDMLSQLEPVGKGSQAIVYSTTQDGMKMAVKVLRPELAADETEHQTFEREVNLLARLAHPNINNVIGCGRHQGNPCALLEWCDSDVTKLLDLRQIELDASGKARRKLKLAIDAHSRLKLCLNLAEAMTFLHSGSALPRCFVMHRDLKPDNLLVDTDRNLKLADFGLAICLSSDDDAVDASTLDAAGLDTTVRRRGRAYHAIYDLTTATGSPRYMAPEVGLGHKYGLKSDIYSYAIVAWEILILARPYGGLSPNDLERRVWGMGLRPQIPNRWHPDLRDLFNAMWHYNPAVRPPFETVLDTLKQLCAETHSKADPLGDHLDSNGTCC